MFWLFTPGSVPSRRATSRNIDAPEPPAMEPTMMGMMTSDDCSSAGISPHAPGATDFACALTSVSRSGFSLGSVSMRPTARYWPAPEVTGMVFAAAGLRGAQPDRPT